MEFHLAEETVVLPPPELIEQGALYVPLEGVLRVRVPFALHQRPENRSLRPTSLRVALLAKTEHDDIFFATEPQAIWVNTRATQLESAAPHRRDSLASTFSDLTTFSSSTTSASVSNASVTPGKESRETRIRNQIFERAIRRGNRCVDFPFRIKVPTMLPPSLLPPDSSIAGISATDSILLGGLASAANTTQLNAKQYKDLILYPKYEIVGTLTFSSFAVTAYQTATVPITLVCSYPSPWMEKEPPKKQLGTTSGDRIDVRSVTTVTLTPMARYRHRDAPFNPIGNTSSNLVTPWEQTGRSVTIDIRSTSAGRFSADHPLKFMVPFLPPLPDAVLGYWRLENHIEVALSYRDQGPMSRVAAVAKLQRSTFTVPVHVACPVPTSGVLDRTMEMFRRMPTPPDWNGFDVRRMGAFVHAISVWWKEEEGIDDAESSVQSPPSLTTQDMPEPMPMPTPPIVQEAMNQPAVVQPPRSSPGTNPSASVSPVLGVSQQPLESMAPVSRPPRTSSAAGIQQQRDTVGLPRPTPPLVARPYGGLQGSSLRLLGSPVPSGRSTATPIPAAILQESANNALPQSEIPLRGSSARANGGTVLQPGLAASHQLLEILTLQQLRTQPERVSSAAAPDRPPRESSAPAVSGDLPTEENAAPETNSTVNDLPVHSGPETSDTLVTGGSPVPPDDATSSESRSSVVIRRPRTTTVISYSSSSGYATESSSQAVGAMSIAESHTSFDMFFKQRVSRIVGKVAAAATSAINHTADSIQDVPSLDSTLLGRPSTTPRPISPSPQRTDHKKELTPRSSEESSESAAPSDVVVPATRSDFTRLTLFFGRNGFSPKLELPFVLDESDRPPDSPPTPPVPELPVVVGNALVNEPAWDDEPIDDDDDTEAVSAPVNPLMERLNDPLPPIPSVAAALNQRGSHTDLSSLRTREPFLRNKQLASAFVSADTHLFGSGSHPSLPRSSGTASTATPTSSVQPAASAGPSSSAANVAARTLRMRRSVGPDAPSASNFFGPISRLMGSPLPTATPPHAPSPAPPLHAGEALPSRSPAPPQQQLQSAAQSRRRSIQDDFATTFATQLHQQPPPPPPPLPAASAAAAGPMRAQTPASPPLQSVSFAPPAAVTVGPAQSQQQLLHLSNLRATLASPPPPAQPQSQTQPYLAQLQQQLNHRHAPALVHIAHATAPASAAASAVAPPPLLDQPSAVLSTAPPPAGATADPAADRLAPPAYSVAGPRISSASTPLPTAAPSTAAAAATAAAAGPASDADLVLAIAALGVPVASSSLSAATAAAAAAAAVPATTTADPASPPQTVAPPLPSKAALAAASLAAAAAASPAAQPALAAADPVAAAPATLLQLQLPQQIAEVAATAGPPVDAQALPPPPPYMAVQHHGGPVPPRTTSGGGGGEPRRGSVSAVAVSPTPPAPPLPISPVPPVGAGSAPAPAAAAQALVFQQQLQQQQQQPRWRAVRPHTPSSKQELLLRVGDEVAV
ncbi:hypothetical protein HK405_010032, partial [Cladochytrium tenue]